MERFFYWIKKFVMGNSRFCRGICMTCPYYEQCSNDGVLE